jgi:hypothetical protein
MNQREQKIEQNVRQQVHALADAFVQEMAKHNVPMQYLRFRTLPFIGSSKEHVELVLEGRCDNETYAGLDRLDETNIAGLTLGQPTLRRDANGQFDPTLGFLWTATAAVDKWPVE